MIAMFPLEDDDDPEESGVFARFFDEQADRVERRICDHDPVFTPGDARRRRLCACYFPYPKERP